MARRRGKRRMPISRRSSSSPRNRIGELSREASNLSATTGCQVAVIAIPPHGEVHCYGSPSVNSVVKRVLRWKWQSNVDKLLRAHIRRKHQAWVGEPLTGKEREVKELEWSIEFLDAFRRKVTSVIDTANAIGSI